MIFKNIEKKYVECLIEVHKDIFSFYLNSIDMKDINYLNNSPKILTNIPKGKDSFKVESHKKIATTIINIIENQSSIIDKQIIGLEGEWGTGKSNIIKIIEEESKDKYLHFTFDTWTHQEDLTRKSIVIELINFLKIKIVSFNNTEWIKKENQLSQKVISKNTKHFPQVKLYYVCLIIGFLIIKFINEVKKQNIDGRLYGYYDNSLSYLKEEFYFNFSNSINITYLFKSIPYLLFMLSLILFLFSFWKSYEENNKKEKKDKLTFLGLVGKSFYWISGEKLESKSDETITEIEPSNLKFRNFLKEIDAELNNSKKTLILTIDNTDRLTSEKLKNIWSTINIFFAESNNSEFLKNIWLIIPYDANKVLKSFENEEIGKGLLEKTFSLNFNVPPPLVSNWELLFKNLFNESFKDIYIIDRESEIDILLRIFESFEENITPRKIINFINQLATYYIQIPSVSLRYFGIVILKKDTLFKGEINENIINRINYLSSLDTLFINDDELELNLAKIIYGVENENDAKESLLHNIIENRLESNKDFEDEIIKLSYFNSYLHKYFKKFLDNTAGFANTENESYFEVITKRLNGFEEIFSDNKKLYSDLWEYYYKKISKNRFTIFNETVRAVCINCSKKSKIELLNKSISDILNVLRNQADSSVIKDYQYKYLNFLKEINSYSSNNKQGLFKEVSISDMRILSEIAIPFIKENKDLYNKFKLSVTEKDLKNYLISQPFDDKIDEQLLSTNKEEILFLSQQHNFDFIVEEINKNWTRKNYKTIPEVETLIFYYVNYKGIKIENLSTGSLVSILNLINTSNDKTNLAHAYYLIIINYEDNFSAINSTVIKEAISRFDKISLKNMIENFKYFSNFPQLFNVFKLNIGYNSIDSSLSEFSQYLLQRDYLKLNDENFNWLLENYSNLSIVIFNNDKSKLYDYLNKKFKNHKINIAQIDSKLITDSKKGLNNQLIKESNIYILDYLKNNNYSLLQNVNNKIHKLFIELLSLEKVNQEVFDNIIPSYISLAFSSTRIPIDHSHLKLIKSKFDKNKLLEAIQPLGRTQNINNIFMLSPEIFTFFSSYNPIQRRNIFEILITHPLFYNTELLEQLALHNYNGRHKTTLKLNLENHQNQDLKEIAIKKGLI